MLFTASTVFANTTHIENTDYIVGEITTFTFPTTQSFAIGHSVNGTGDFVAVNGVVFDMTSHTLKVARTSPLGFSTTHTALTNGDITASYSSFTVTLGVVNTALQSLYNRDAWLRENSAILSENETVTGSWTFSGVVNRANVTNFTASTATITSVQSNFKIRREGGQEGGQFIMEIPSTNTTLGGDVIVDVERNNFRIRENGGAVRGAFLDISKCANGVNSVIWHSDNDGSGSGLDADTVDGYQVGATYGSIPYMTSVGVMEIGRYLDFHSTNNYGAVDYDVRIDSDQYGLVFYRRDGGHAALGLGNVVSNSYMFREGGDDTGFYSGGDGQINFKLNNEVRGYFSRDVTHLYSHKLYIGDRNFSNIHMRDTDEGDRIIHCNSHRIGFLNQSEAWGSYCNDDGSWSSDFYMTAPYFNAVSKRALKENIQPITYSALDIIDTVDVVSFNFKADETKDYKVGFIADDTDEKLSGKDQDKMDMNNCIGLLLKAVQELREENRQLKIKLGVE